MRPSMQPSEDYVLIEPLKEIKLSKKVEVEDSEANEGKLPHEVHETKTVKKRVPANHQLGRVVAMGRQSSLYGVGDVVVYPTGQTVPFDLIKGLSLLRYFSIVGVWSAAE